jgi:hypothetical protein
MTPLCWEQGIDRFQYTFVNTLPPAEQRAAHERCVVPESRRVPRESLTARIDFKQPHPPLLLIAGSADHIIPASLNKSNYARYRSAPSVTGFKEFAGRTHFIGGQQGWEEVADYVLGWLNEQGVWEVSPGERLKAIEQPCARGSWRAA